MKRSLTLQIFDDINKKYRPNEDTSSESESESEAEEIFFNPNNFVDDSPPTAIMVDTDEENNAIVSLFIILMGWIRVLGN